jgi:hypothetical protein
MPNVTDYPFGAVGVAGLREGKKTHERDRSPVRGVTWGGRVVT